MKLSILISLFSIIFCVGCRSQTTAPAEVKSDFIPWLSISGLYGFCDSSGKLVIQPQYDDAYRFVNGFAEVAKEGKYGVINSQNQVVIPLKYPTLQLTAYHGLALAITKKEYNAWWRFWNWKILPEWNILGGNSGPFLVTKVPRAHWQVVALPQKKTLFSDRRTDQYTTFHTNQYWKDDWIPDRSVPEDINILSTPTMLVVGQKVFAYEKDGRLKRIKNGFQSFVNGNTFISNNERSYILKDGKVKQLEQKRYREENGIQLKTSSGEAIFVPKNGEMGDGYPIIDGKIFTDQNGLTYLLPDFSKPFPKVVYDYQSVYDTVSAKEIFKQVVMVVPLSSTSYFLILSAAGKGEKGGSGWKCYFLKENGQWKSDIPVYQGPRNILDNGEITFEGSRNRLGVLDTDFQFHAMPLVYIQPVMHHPFWYMGQDTATKKYGVYDVKNKRWQVPPDYDYLQDQVSADVAIYSIIKSDTIGDQFGLINMTTNKRITPPVYRKLSPDGRVISLNQHENKAFYINLKNGEEYRKK